MDAVIATLGMLLAFAAVGYMLVIVCRELFGFKKINIPLSALVAPLAFTATLIIYAVTVKYFQGERAGEGLNLLLSGTGGLDEVQGLTEGGKSVSAPLFSLVVAGLARLGVNVVTAAEIISVVSFISGSVLVFLIAKKRGQSEQAALRAELLFMILPFSIRLILPGFSSMLLLCVLAAYYFSLCKNGVAAVIFSCIATLVSPLGFVSIALLYTDKKDWRRVLVSGIISAVFLVLTILLLKLDFFSEPGARVAGLFARQGEAFVFGSLPLLISMAAVPVLLYFIKPQVTASELCYCLLIIVVALCSDKVGGEIIAMMFPLAMAFSTAEENKYRLVMMCLGILCGAFAAFGAIYALC